MESEEQTKDIKVFLSTDGKMTVSFQATDIKEAEKLYTTVEPLFKRLIQLMNDNNLKSVRSAFPPKQEKDWTGKDCPRCGKRLYKTTTKSGKGMIKCEGGKWNFMEKKNEGCEYIEWLDTFSAPQQDDIDRALEIDDSITPAQKNVILKALAAGTIDIDVDDLRSLTRKKASLIISSLKD